jgi:hypothetical protein
MSQSTYRHYPSFTRRYVRSVMKMMDLPKKPKMEAEVFGQMVHDEQVVHSINGEMLMLAWHHGREGRVVVPEPSLSSGVPGWMKNKHPEGQKGVPFLQIGYDREDRELKLAMTAPRTVSPYWRQLRDERFYRGKWADHRRGSRYVLVSGYEVWAGKTMGVEPMHS